jgi:hypothetical protein
MINLDYYDHWSISCDSYINRDNLLSWLTESHLSGLIRATTFAGMGQP